MSCFFICVWVLFSAALHPPCLCVTTVPLLLSCNHNPKIAERPSKPGPHLIDLPHIREGCTLFPVYPFPGQSIISVGGGSFLTLRGQACGQANVLVYCISSPEKRATPAPLKPP
ncbi:unnamed protein product [Discosporangium mesarthrocarpum]